MGELEMRSSTEACEEKDCKKEEPKIISWLSKGSASWGLAKATIFVACATFFVQQSAEFSELYYTYPTTISVAVITPEEIMKPAITICDTNIMQRSRYCAEFPDACQEPNDLPEFCQKHSHYCTGNNSNLQIPKLGYYADSSADTEIRTATILEGLHVDNKLNEFSFDASWMYGKRTVIFNFPDFYDRGHCRSENLHLDDNEEAETVFQVPKDPADSPQIEVYDTVLFMDKSEVFLPWDEPRLLLSIHSPFIRSNPMKEANSFPLEAGYEYIVVVSLEEQHLLPHPYPTNCRDYETDWERNNRTGPRSKEMCVELCDKTFRGCRGRIAFAGGTHYLSEEDVQDVQEDDLNCVHTEKDREMFFVCSKNCKTNCIKRGYAYTVNKRRPVSPIYGFDSTMLRVHVYLDGPEVIVMAHNPLYNDGELFSYIGGLMGCWLGMSVWAFTGIFETTFLRILLTIQTIRRSRQASNADDAA